MFKKLMVFLLVAMLLIPTTGALALEYLPQTTYAAFDSYQSGMLNGGYWNSTYEGYSLKWDAENGEYPDVLWRIYCSQDGLYEFVMNYITLQSNTLDRVYIDNELLATDEVFGEWMKDYADTSLGNFYLTEGMHTIKFSEGTNINGFLVKSITIKDAMEGYPIIGEQDLLRIQAETDSTDAIKMVSNSSITKKVVAPKAGKYYIGISWCAYTGSNADIYINNFLTYADVVPSVVLQEGYEWNSNYLKDFYEVELNQGLNEIKIAADAKDYIYIDFIDIVDVMDTTDNPNKSVRISAHNCTHWQHCDVSYNTRGFTAKVNVVQGGEYNLSLRWSGYDGSDTATINVNGETIGSFKPTQQDTMNYGVPEFFMVDTYKVNLKSGENIIFVKADDKKWVYLDYVEISAIPENSGGKIEFDKYVLSSSDGEVIIYETLNDAKAAGVADVNVVGKATNNTLDVASVTVFAAAYDLNGKITDVAVEVLDNVAAEASADICVSVRITDAVKIKVFAVKSTLSLAPISGGTMAFE